MIAYFVSEGLPSRRRRAEKYSWPYNNQCSRSRIKRVRVSGRSSNGGQASKDTPGALTDLSRVLGSMESGQQISHSAVWFSLGATLRTPTPGLQEADSAGNEVVFRTPTIILKRIGLHSVRPPSQGQLSLKGSAALRNVFRASVQPKTPSLGRSMRTPWLLLHQGDA